MSSRDKTRGHSFPHRVHSSRMSPRKNPGKCNYFSHAHAQRYSEMVWVVHQPSVCMKLIHALPLPHLRVRQSSAIIDRLDWEGSRRGVLK
jgi:hypothetical protein